MGTLTRLACLVTVALLGAACGASTATSGSAPAPTSPPSLGVLEGRVTIGPLVPVEREGVPTPTVPPETYTSRSLNIYEADGATLVTNVPFKGDGTYRVELAPGTYVVKLARSGLDRASSLPQTIAIRAGETVQLDIDIDTGIR